MKGPDFWRCFSGTFKCNTLLSLRMEKKYRLHMDDPEHWTSQQVSEIWWGKWLDV